MVPYVILLGKLRVLFEIFEEQIRTCIIKLKGELWWWSSDNSAFYFDFPSSNPADIYIFSVNLLVK